MEAIYEDYEKKNIGSTYLLAYGVNNTTRGWDDRK
jgi:hypothetical protein